MLNHQPYVLAVLAASALVASVAFAYPRVTSPGGSDDAVTQGLQEVHEEATEAAEEDVAAMPTEEHSRSTARASDDDLLGMLGSPMTDARERVLKKPFGKHITPETSPVPDDRFTGYHVGVDFEVFDNEQDIDVPVFAVCDGPLLFEMFAKGYGGVAVQSCMVEGRTLHIIYGHIRRESVTHKAGVFIQRGEQIAVLGNGHSPETDGVRKHLHLGIHEGAQVDIRGYVKTEDEMSAWSDALEMMGR